MFPIIVFMLHILRYFRVCQHPLVEGLFFHVIATLHFVSLAMTCKGTSHFSPLTSSMSL